MSGGRGRQARGRDARLVPAALAAWLVAAVAVGLPDAARWIAVAGTVAAVAVAAVAVLRRSGRSSPAAVAVGAAALVAVAVAVGVEVRAPESLTRSAGRVLMLEMIVEGTADEGRVPGRAVLVRPGASGDRADPGGVRIDVPVLLFGDRGAPPPPVGALLLVRATAVAADPGDRVAFLLFPRGGVKVVGAPTALAGWAAGLRDGFRALAADLPPPGGDLLPGLAIGDTGAVDPTLDAAMRAGSLTHLTAVSGANCAIVVALALLLGAALGAPRWLRVLGAAGLLGAFVVLVTPEPSVQRAAVMAALALIAAGVGRRSAGLPLLCGAVTVLLAIDPWLARDAGFVLSVVATAALLTLTGALGEAFARVLPRGLALVLAVPVAAQLACQPVLVLLDPSLPLYGVPANLLAAPAAPLATVIGLLACVTTTIAPPLAVALGWLAWLPSSWIAGVATLTAALPGARLPWLPGIAGAVAVAVLAALAVGAVLPSPRGRARVVAAGLVLLIGAAYLGAVGGARLASLAGRPGDWAIAQCDIGQGDAVLLRSAGRIALIDTGPDPAALRACFDELGIARLDLLVLTHFDLDHVGGVDAVLGRADRVLVGPPGGPDDERLSARLRAAGAAVESASRGDRGRLGELEWVVRWPPDRGVEPGNDASVALEVRPSRGCRVGCVSLLLLGDLGEESQRRMAAAAGIRPVDVVKVAHHGSADQSTQLYAGARAAVGLIGVGADNDYGHPTAALLAMLDGAGTRAFRSDRDGLVLVSDRGGAGLAVWRERGG